MSGLLKSDHFGIEIRIKRHGITHPQRLKSDHFGIEMIIVLLILGKYNLLKSDHFGIEMPPIQTPD